MLRDWLNTSGLVLFSPRAQQLPASSPSFVEVVLGAATPTPSLSDLTEPRTMLARLIADGGAIPLNLLGSPTGAGTETPDFIVSPLAFSYIFTLRGDKTWKQPPVTIGTGKVSPLALASYNLITAKGQLSAVELASELGKEVTAAAALRALTELWQHLRVLPVLQADGTPTLWELATTRYTKQIKAGVNAGQPTAISALISLYLGQAILPTEDEIEVFLSPLAARSRIRDAVHALTAARQMESVVIDGKAHMHVAGEMPELIPDPEVVTPAPDDVDAVVVTTEGENAAPRQERISKFAASKREFKPRREEDSRGPSRERKPFDRTAGPRSDSERRPFNRASRPEFTRPWDEEKKERSERRPRAVEGESQEAPRKPRFTGDRDQRGSSRPRFDRGEKRPSYGERSGADRRDRPRDGGERPFRKFDAPRGDSRPPRREGADFAAGGESRPRRSFGEKKPFGARKPFDEKKDFGERKPFGDRKPFGEKRSFDRKPAGEGRSFGDRKPFGERKSFGDRKPFGEKKDFGARKPFGEKKDFGERKPFGEKRSFDRKPAGEGRSFGDRKPFGEKKDFGARKPFGEKKSFGDRKPAGDKRPFTGKKPFGDRAASGEAPRFAKKKTFDKPFRKDGATGARKPGGFKKEPGKDGPFAKFVGNKKPFGKRGAPARKPRTESEE
jgi:hypothetical protein